MQRVQLLFWIRRYSIVVIIVASTTVISILQRPSLSLVPSLTFLSRRNRFDSGIGIVRNLKRQTCASCTFYYRSCKQRLDASTTTSLNTIVSNTSSSKAAAAGSLDKRNKMNSTNDEEQMRIRHQFGPSLVSSPANRDNQTTILETVSETLCGLLAVGTFDEKITKQTMIDALHILRTVSGGGGGDTIEASITGPGTTKMGGSQTMKSIPSSESVTAGAGVMDQLLHNLCVSATMAAYTLVQISSSPISIQHKKKTWQALQDATEIFHNNHHSAEADSSNNNKQVVVATTGYREEEMTAMTMPTMSESNALAVSLVFGVLALWPANDVHGSSSKAAASALSSTTSRNKPLRHVGRPLASYLARTYLTHACNSDTFQLQILTYFAKAFKLGDDCVDPMLTATAIRYAIRLGLDDDSSSSSIVNTRSIDMEASVLMENDGVDADPQKQRISGALALACQLQPWSVLSPVGLVDAAIPYDLWQTAEDICRSAHQGGQPSSSTSSQSSSTSIPSGGGRSGTFSTTKQEENTRIAVERLIDVALEDRMFRRADSLATNLYDMGGQSRYVEARYYHACETISKVITRRQMPIIDRQIERVDRAVDQIAGGEGGSSSSSSSTKRDSTVETQGSSDATVVPNSARREEVNAAYTPSLRMVFDPRIEIRKFALEKLEEAGEITAAQRLATLNGMDYIRDEQALLAAATSRREKYLQYDDLLRGPLPTLISNPDDLRSSFVRLLESPHRYGPFGFDAEWDDESSGAAVLQLANSDTALLIDIPSLSSTEEGLIALEETVGKLFSCTDSIVAGFACRQDLSRLRSSPCVRRRSGNCKNHWMSGTRAVVDVQNLVGKAEPKLFKAGLARVCQFYLGKPLDKAEQCSVWSARPLSDNQRAYAALDAWVCIGIYKKARPPTIDRKG
jgi:hypothetical protein